MKWVYTAYGMAWAVHIIYIITLTRGYQRLRREIEDLQKP